MTDPVEQTAPRSFQRKLSINDTTLVISFGVSRLPGCADGCCPPLVAVALGVAGEFERPVMKLFDVDQAEDFVARLQLQISLARGEKPN